MYYDCPVTCDQGCCNKHVPCVGAADHSAETSEQNGTSFWFPPWGTCHHEGKGLPYAPLLAETAWKMLLDACLFDSA